MSRIAKNLQIFFCIASLVFTVVQIDGCGSNGGNGGNGSNSGTQPGGGAQPGGGPGGGVQPQAGNDIFARDMWFHSNITNQRAAEISTEEPGSLKILYDSSFAAAVPATLTIKANDFPPIEKNVTLNPGVSQVYSLDMEGIPVPGDYPLSGEFHVQDADASNNKAIGSVRVVQARGPVLPTDAIKAVSIEFIDENGNPVNTTQAGRMGKIRATAENKRNEPVIVRLEMDRLNFARNEDEFIGNVWNFMIPAHSRRSYERPYEFVSEGHNKLWLHAGPQEFLEGEDDSNNVAWGDVTVSGEMPRQAGDINVKEMYFTDAQTDQRIPRGARIDQVLLCHVVLDSTFTGPQDPPTLFLIDGVGQVNPMRINPGLDQNITTSVAFHTIGTHECKLELFINDDNTNNNHNDAWVHVEEPAAQAGTGDLKVTRMYFERGTTHQESTETPVNEQGVIHILFEDTFSGTNLISPIVKDNGTVIDLWQQSIPVTSQMRELSGFYTFTSAGNHLLEFDSNRVDDDVSNNTASCNVTVTGTGNGPIRLIPFPRRPRIIVPVSTGKTYDLTADNVSFWVSYNTGSSVTRASVGDSGYFRYEIYNGGETTASGVPITFTLTLDGVEKKRFTETVDIPSHQFHHGFTDTHRFTEDGHYIQRVTCGKSTPPNNEFHRGLDIDRGGTDLGSTSHDLDSSSPRRPSNSSNTANALSGLISGMVTDSGSTTTTSVDSGKSSSSGGTTKAKTLYGTKTQY